MCIALIVVPFVFVGGYSLLVHDVFDDEFDDTDEELLSSEVPGKQNPLVLPIQSHSLAPALFNCTRTTMIHLLLAMVVEPPFSSA